jgi:hypothetical protein
MRVSKKRVKSRKQRHKVNPKRISRKRISRKRISRKRISRKKHRVHRGGLQLFSKKKDIDREEEVDANIRKGEVLRMEYLKQIYIEYKKVTEKIKEAEKNNSKTINPDDVNKKAELEKKLKIEMEKHTPKKKRERERQKRIREIYRKLGEEHRMETAITKRRNNNNKTASKHDIPNNGKQYTKLMQIGINPNNNNNNNNNNTTNNNNNNNNTTNNNNNNNNTTNNNNNNNNTTNNNKPKKKFSNKARDWLGEYWSKRREKKRRKERNNIRNRTFEPLNPPEFEIGSLEESLKQNNKGITIINPELPQYNQL